jgi:hypothetical protein
MKNPTLQAFAASLALAFLVSPAVPQTLPGGPVPDGMTYREWITEVRKKDAQRIIDEGTARPADKTDKAPKDPLEFLKELSTQKK